MRQAMHLRYATCIVVASPYRELSQTAKNTLKPSKQDLRTQPNRQLGHGARAQHSPTIHINTPEGLRRLV
jgi:hypothetical protein